MARPMRGGGWRVPRWSFVVGAVAAALAQAAPSAAQASGVQPVAAERDDASLRIHVHTDPEGEGIRDRTDSVKDLEAALRKTEWAVVVGAPELADLDVEITGRGSRAQPGRLPPPILGPRPTPAGRQTAQVRSELAVYASVRVLRQVPPRPPVPLVGTSRSYRWRGCATDLAEQLRAWMPDGRPAP